VKVSFDDEYGALRHVFNDYAAIVGRNEVGILQCTLVGLLDRLKAKALRRLAKSQKTPVRDALDRVRLRIGLDDRVGHSDRNVYRIIMLEGLEHIADDRVADERTDGVVKEKQDFACVGVFVVGADCGERGLVSLGAAEEDALDLREPLAAHHVLDVTPA